MNLDAWLTLGVLAGTLALLARGRTMSALVGTFVLGNLISSTL